MPYSIKAVDKEKYLMFIVEGEAAGFDDISAYADNALSLAFEYERNRILFDETQAVIRFDAHDVFLLAEHLVDLNVAAMGVRAAIVCAQSNCAMTRCVETALQNRSINCKMFEDMKSAEEWLEK